MIHLICCAVVLLVAAPGQHAAPTRKDAMREAEFTRLETMWNEAHQKGDADALDRLFADDIAITVPRMPTMGKADVMAMWRSGRASFQKYESSISRTQVYRDAAVVTGRLHRVRDFGGRIAEEDWQFTKTY